MSDECKFCGNSCATLEAVVHPKCSEEFWRRKSKGLCSRCGNDPVSDKYSGRCVVCSSISAYKGYPGGSA